MHVSPRFYKYRELEPGTLKYTEAIFTKNEVYFAPSASALEWSV